MNSLDESVSDCGKEVYQLFTFDIHSVRTDSVQKMKNFLATIKLAATDDVFVWSTLQLNTASTTNTLAVDDLTSMCPVGLILPSQAVLHTYGGVIKPVGKVELVCETQGELRTLKFQLLSKEVMGSQPPLQHASS